MAYRVLIGTVFVLLGAIFNVCVSVGCMRWGYKPDLDVPNVPLFGSEDYLLPQAQRLWRRYAPDAWPQFGRFTRYYRESGAFMTNEFVIYVPAQQFDPRNQRGVGERRVGWPLRSFSTGWYADDNSMNVLSAWWTSFGLMPYHVLWLGLTVNTVFFAAVLWLLCSCPRRLRRIVRIRHGRCPCCGYPVGASPVCSECGVKVSSRPVA